MNYITYYMLPYNMIKLFKRDIRDSNINYIKKNIRNIDVNESDKDGITPLIFASLRGENQLVELFINNGSCINAQDVTGSTALIWACMRKNLDVIKILLKHNADVNLHDTHGHTALRWVCIYRNINILKLFIDYGVVTEINNVDWYLSIRECLRHSPIMLKMLISINHMPMSSVHYYKVLALNTYASNTHCIKILNNSHFYINYKKNIYMKLIVDIIIDNINKNNTHRYSMYDIGTIISKYVPTYVCIYHEDNTNTNMT